MIHPRTHGSYAYHYPSVDAALGLQLFTSRVWLKWAQTAVHNVGLISPDKK